MKVELLWWRGCPSWEATLELLRGELAALGLDPDAVDVVEVSTDAEAVGRGFVGSPTIRIDGADVQPPAGEPAGLTCRVYRLRDGRVSALPDPADVRVALERALGRVRAGSS